MSDEEMEVPESGYITLPRDIFSWPVFADESLFRLGMTLAIKASHKPRSVAIACGRGTRVVHLRRGELITGRYSLAKVLGWPPATVRDRLARLQQVGFITLKPSRQFTVVAIVNYAVFQCRKTARRPPNDHQKEAEISTPNARQKSAKSKKTTTGRPPNDHQTTQIRIKKHSKKGRSGTPSPVSIHPPSLQDVLGYAGPLWGWAEDVARGFIAKNEATGWRDRNGQPVVDWQAWAEVWERNRQRFEKLDASNGSGANVSATARRVV